jgi:hypothetical protein
MRKKKETPSGTKRGRPRNSGLTVPSWAHKAISALSDHSGVTSQKILEVALRDGIQLVGEPLGAWVNYQKSSEKLWNEHVTHPEKDNRQEPQPAIDDVGTFEPGGLDSGDLGYERGEPVEVPEDHEVVQILSSATAAEAYLNQR